MKVHSTNYENTLILPSEDCKSSDSIPPARPGTVGALQYELLSAGPYTLTSDDLLVAFTGQRKDIPEDEWPDLRAEIFSKGQPCLRASPLVKTMGWAVHHDGQGRLALVDVASEQFQSLLDDVAVAKIQGMRNARAR